MYSIGFLVVVVKGSLYHQKPSRRLYFFLLFLTDQERQYFTNGKIIFSKWFKVFWNYL